MTIFSTEHFKVFRMKINGVTYYFVGKNKENSGYMFSYTTLNDAVFACKQLQNAYEIGTLIM